MRIAVDIPSHAEHIEIDVICDGRTWARNQVQISGRDSTPVSLWVRGLGENCDVANTAVTLDGTRLKVTYVSALDAVGARQINADLAPDTAHGVYAVQVQYAGVSARPGELRVIRAV